MTDDASVDVDARVGGHLRLVMASDTDPGLRSAVDLLQG
jgi:hypothetical protein